MEHPGESITVRDLTSDICLCEIGGKPEELLHSAVDVDGVLSLYRIDKNPFRESSGNAAWRENPHRYFGTEFLKHLEEEAGETYARRFAELAQFLTTNETKLKELLEVDVAYFLPFWKIFGSRASKSAQNGVLGARQNGRTILYKTPPTKLPAAPKDIQSLFENH